MIMYHFEGLDKEDIKVIAEGVARVTGMPEKQYKAVEILFANDVDELVSCVMVSCFLKFLNDNGKVDIAQIVKDNPNPSEFIKDPKNREMVQDWHRMYFSDFLANCFFLSCLGKGFSGHTVIDPLKIAGVGKSVH